MFKTTFKNHITVNTYIMKLKILFLFISPIFFFSCMTTPKNIAYFQDLETYRQNALLANSSLGYEPVIKKFDELMITVTAPVLEQASIAQFNLPMTSYLSNREEIGIQQSIALQTYIVDNDGAINYPVIGRIPLAGLTKSQAIEKIKKLVSDHINTEPVISMKIMSFQVSVLGEVFKPGPVPIKQERMSILDALGAAGDLTIYGNRQNVLLIRENDNGPDDYIRFDLTKSDIFNSPYYYLQQNDKIIVEPNKTRQLESKYGPADSYKLSIFSIVFSAVSVIASTTVAIVSLRKN